MRTTTGLEPRKEAKIKGWVEYRELNSLAEFQEFLKLRYRVYTSIDWIEENADQLDIDCYDIHSRFVGAFYRVGGREVMVAGARMILPHEHVPGATQLAEIRESARADSIRNLGRRKSLYYTQHAPGLESVVQFSQKENLLLVEFGRTVCLPEYQGLGLGMGLVHVLHGMALNWGVDLAIAASPPHLQSFYERFGCKVLVDGARGRCANLNTDVVPLVVDLRKLSGPFRQAYKAADQLRRFGHVRLCADRNCLLLHQHQERKPEPSRRHPVSKTSPTPPPLQNLLPLRPVALHDETLRDGLQSSSVVTPDLDTKVGLLHRLAEAGIESANLGLPGAGMRFQREAARLLKEIREHRLPVAPTLAGRTLKSDIDPIVAASEAAGVPVEAGLFIGSSPIRHLCEEWSLDHLLRLTEESVTYAVEKGLKVMFVTEDTVRAHPQTLEKLYTVAIECGATRLCLCDTVGHAIPGGVHRLVRFVRQLVRKTGEDVAIDWHGHRDRGLAVANSLAAIEAGVDRVHGTALGVGERVGNTPIEMLLLHLERLSGRELDHRALHRYLEAVSLALAVPLSHKVPGEVAREGKLVHA